MVSADDVDLVVVYIYFKNFCKEHFQNLKYIQCKKWYSIQLYMFSIKNSWELGFFYITDKICLAWLKLFHGTLIYLLLGCY